MLPWELQFSFMGSLPHCWSVICEMQELEGLSATPGLLYFLVTLVQLSTYFLPDSWSISVLLKHFIKKSSDKSLQCRRGLFLSSYHGLLLTHLLQEVRDGSWKPQSCMSLQTVCDWGKCQSKWLRPKPKGLWKYVGLLSVKFIAMYFIITVPTRKKPQKLQFNIWKKRSSSRSCEFAAQSVEKKITQWDFRIPVGMLTSFFPS